MEISENLRRIERGRWGRENIRSRNLIRKQFEEISKLKQQQFWRSFLEEKKNKGKTKNNPADYWKSTFGTTFWIKIENLTQMVLIEGFGEANSVGFLNRFKAWISFFSSTCGKVLLDSHEWWFLFLTLSGIKSHKTHRRPFQIANSFDCRMFWGAGGILHSISKTGRTSYYCISI